MGCVITNQLPHAKVLMEIFAPDGLSAGVTQGLAGILEWCGSFTVVCSASTMQMLAFLGMELDVQFRP
jgi:hypothetical protein